MPDGAERWGVEYGRNFSGASNPPVWLLESCWWEDASPGSTCPPQVLRAEMWLVGYWHIRLTQCCSRWRPHPTNCAMLWEEMHARCQQHQGKADLSTYLCSHKIWSSKAAPSQKSLLGRRDVIEPNGTWLSSSYGWQIYIWPSHVKSNTSDFCALSLLWKVCSEVCRLNKLLLFRHFCTMPREKTNHHPEGFIFGNLNARFLQVGQFRDPRNWDVLRIWETWACGNSKSNLKLFQSSPVFVEPAYMQ